MNVNLREEILTQIDKTDDKTQRTVFLLLFATLEHITETNKAVHEKLDKALSDESRLQKLVLNGHVSNHHEDHDWIAVHRVREAEIDTMLKRAKPLCEYVEKLKDKEESLQKIKSNRVRAALDFVAERSLWALIGLAVGLLVLLSNNPILLKLLGI